MAKRKASGTSKVASTTRKSSSARKAAIRQATKANTRSSRVQKASKPVKRAASAAKKARSAKSATPAGGRKKVAASKKAAAKTRKAKARARKAPANRRRDVAPFPTPPSSLNMNRRGSAARTGRDEMAEERADHATMTPSITGGDVDANVEDAYFTGDEAPGGDNPTPDQDIVDDIGRALGVEYQDNEELRGSDKVADRDKHRWELDPASSEDYRDRK
jgi:hypothetical protein